MKELIGHKIFEIETADNGWSLFFRVNSDEYLGYSTEADCCASAWFESVPSSEDGCAFW